MHFTIDDESSDAAFEIAFGAFQAARHAELQATLGRVPDHTEHSVVGRAESPEVVDDDAERLRSFATAPLAFDVTLDDGIAEAQLTVDRAALLGAQAAAERHGVRLFGEEDEFRGRNEAHRQRASAALKCISAGEAFAINDPVDGSNQLAGMGNRSGWCAATLVKMGGKPANVCIINGDGRAWLTENSSGDGRVLYNEIDPQVHPASEQHRAGWIPIPHECTPRLIFTKRLHYIIPASKQKSILRVAEMMKKDSSMLHIAPLAGNPGLMAGLFCAGAAGGYQPASWPWDQLWALPAAVQHLTILSDADESILLPDDIEFLLINSLLKAEPVPALYVGKTHAHAIHIRNLVRNAE